MAITLTHLGTTAHLSNRLEWTDEWSWSPVVHSTAWSTTGALLLDVGAKLAGRPITLDGNATQAWISRSLCETLRAWSALPGVVFQLTLRGATHSVVFDHEKGGFNAAPVWRLLDGEESPTQYFIPTFRFLEV